MCASCRRAREVRRGSRHVRGYDTAWEQLRDAFMADPAHRWCAHCRARGRHELATEADHIVPFAGPDDPRRLDRSNLQPLCGPCHRRKTAAQRGVIWNGEMDRRETCDSLVGHVPSTLAPARVRRLTEPF